MTPLPLRLQDLTGRTFSYLTVVAPADKRDNDRMWRCPCNAERIVATSQLTLAADRCTDNRCKACRSAARTARKAVRVARIHERCIDAWKRTGSLWGPNGTARLVASVRSALEAAFGPAERYEGGFGTEDAWSPPPVAVQDGDGAAYPVDDGCYTLEEVGAALGVCRERARQIEEKALAKFAIGLYRECPDLFDGRSLAALRIVSATSVKRRTTAAARARTYAAKTGRAAPALPAAPPANNVTTEAA